MRNTADRQTRHPKSMDRRQEEAAILNLSGIRAYSANMRISGEQDTPPGHALTLGL